MRAHYLPQMYLKRFLNGDELFVYDRVLRKSRPSGLRTVASITDYYILKDDGGNRDESVEHGFLESVETSAAPILDLLDRGSTVSDEQHGIVAVFFALLCTRVPAFERAHANIGDALVKLTMRRRAGTPERAAELLSQKVGPRSYSAEQLADFVNRGEYTATQSSNERIMAMIDMAEHVPFVKGPSNGEAPGSILLVADLTGRRGCSYGPHCRSRGARCSSSFGGGYRTPFEP